MYLLVVGIVFNSVFFRSIFLGGLVYCLFFAFSGAYFREDLYFVLFLYFLWHILGRLHFLFIFAFLVHILGFFL